MKKIKLLAIFILFSAITYAQTNSFEKSFSFLENCATENAKLPEIVGYPFKFSSDEYLSQMNFSPCELENFDGGFLVFCVNEKFHSLPVSTIVIPFETDFMMIYGLVINKSVDETFKTLNPLMKVQLLTQDIKPEDTYGKALLHKMDENRTMLYCELPDFVNQ